MKKNKKSIALINYANSEFTQSQRLNSKTGLKRGGVSKVISYSLDNIDTEFYAQNHKILNSKKGDGYIDPDVKKNFSKMRNKKQAAFWLLSYKNSKHELSLKEKWSFVIKILKLDFSLKNSYRIFL